MKCNIIKKSLPVSFLRYYASHPYFLAFRGISVLRLNINFVQKSTKPAITDECSSELCNFETFSMITHMIRQKRLRKSVTLTDAQSRKLHELSEFDGTDPVEHAMRAIDEYLKKQKLDFTPPKEKDISAEFRDRSGDPHIQGAVWLSGVVDRYEFSALIMKIPAKSAIDKGKISKLSIWDPVILQNTNNFIGSCIVNYDRGWDIKPSKLAEPYYNKVKALLDKSAEKFIKKKTVG
jgi:hypothetical protein